MNSPFKPHLDLGEEGSLAGDGSGDSHIKPENNPFKLNLYLGEEGTLAGDGYVDPPCKVGEQSL